MKRNQRMLAFLAFAMYFLTGAVCMLVGSSLPQLVELYGLDLNKVVLLGSAFALGRFATVYQTGRLVEKIGPIKVLAIGTALIALYLFGIPTIVNFYAGMCFAFMGGAGMGAQDTVCPVFLSRVFKHNYAGALSAGQALFGLGCFATPFLVGVMLTVGLPFYYGYYILLLVPAAMLFCIPFVKFDRSVQDAEQEEAVQPLYAKKTVIAYAAILITCAAYSAVVNIMGMYTSTLAESVGVSAASSAFMLTVYNIGSTAGSCIFVLILKKVSARSVLLYNNVSAFAAIALALVLNSSSTYFILFFVAGFFLGVLFSVIVNITTRIGYKRISMAGSMVATASGGSDILTPIITGQLVAMFGVRSSYYYSLAMVVICIIGAIIIKVYTTGKKEEV